MTTSSTKTSSLTLTPAIVAGLLHQIASPPAPFTLLCLPFLSGTDYLKVFTTAQLNPPKSLFMASIQESPHAWTHGGC